MFDNIYLDQTFTECVFNQYTYFYIFKCQMLLQGMEYSVILLVFWAFSFMSDWYVNMSNVTVGYGRFSNIILFYGNFHILQRV